MASRLPNVAKRFADETQRSLDVVSATEALWLTAPPTSLVRQQLKVPQLEALYEAGYLRVFTSWENALEDLTLYYLAGYTTPNYTPTFVQGKARSRTLGDARTVLFGNKRYLLWHNPQRVIERVSQHLANSPIETTLTANRNEIDDFADVRHGIAHASADAKANVRAASVRLCGSEHATPGRFLRSARLDDPLNQTKWLLIARDRLVAMINAMTA